MHLYPVIVSQGTDRKENELIRYWLEEIGQQQPLQHREVEVGALSQTERLHFFPDSNWKHIQELLEWNVPVLHLVGRSIHSDSEAMSALQHRYYNLGGTALFAWPALQFMGALPILPFKRPSQSQTYTFILSQNQKWKRNIRQLLYFSGRDARTDFSSGLEILEYLEKNAVSSDRRPALLVIDLNTPGVEIDRMVQYLRKLNRKPFHERPSVDLLVVRDFSHPLPGFDQISTALKTVIRRIFHPEEALFALAEALILHSDLHNPGSGWNTRYRPPDLNTLLYGEMRGYPGENPGDFLSGLQNRITGFQRGLPFLWLYPFLFDTGRKQRGVTLTHDGN